MLYAFKPIQAKYLVALKQSKSNLNSLETLQQQSSDHDNSSQIQNLEGKNARSWNYYYYMVVVILLLIIHTKKLN